RRLVRCRRRGGRVGRGGLSRFADDKTLGGSVTQDKTRAYHTFYIPRPSPQFARCHTFITRLPWLQEETITRFAHIDFFREEIDNSQRDLPACCGRNVRTLGHFGLRHGRLLIWV